MNKDFLTNTTVKLLAKSEKTRLGGGENTAVQVQCTVYYVCMQANIIQT